MTRLLALLMMLAIVTGGCMVDSEDDVGQTAEEIGTVRPLFDLSTTRCPDIESSCPVPAPLDDKGIPKCFCVDDLEHQNYVVKTGGEVRGHYLAVGADTYRDAILSAGNRPAFYVDGLNDDWQTLGAQGKAQALWDSAFNKFNGNVPTWFVMNEVSKSQWRSVPAYRNYVVALATRLNQDHGRKVLIFSPFSAPGLTLEGHAPSWTALAKHAFIGAENYLSGAEIKNNGFSESWCRDQYQKSLTWYGKMGVPATRLVLVEHFGHTTSDYEYGRGGLVYDEWLKALRVRTRAARSLPFFGYASYGWASNHMNALNPRRQEAQDVYHQVIEDAPLSISPITTPSDSPPPTTPPTEEDPPPSMPPADGNDVMAPGTELVPGASVTSSDGRFTFVYQTDGNLVLYNGSAPLWASNTQNTMPGVTIMQPDGNLVVYDNNGAPRWASNTYNHAGAQLLVQNDGNVVIYGPDAQPLWATNTCCL